MQPYDDMRKSALVQFKFNGIVSPNPDSTSGVSIDYNETQSEKTKARSNITKEPSLPNETAPISQEEKLVWMLIEWICSSTSTRSTTMDGGYHLEHTSCRGFPQSSIFFSCQNNRSSLTWNSDVSASHSLKLKCRLTLLRKQFLSIILSHSLSTLRAGSNALLM